VAAVLAVVSIGALAACTSRDGATSGGGGSSVAAPSGTGTAPGPGRSTAAPSVPSGAAGSPTGSAAPTRTVSATTCPFVRTAVVRSTLGMRLGRLTVLRSGGRTVGCRFYALQGTALHESEHLPGPKQPVLEITTERYPDATAAHNAFVLLARAGRSPVQVPLAGGLTGVCYQTDFYPKDRGRDYACGVSRERTRVLVRSVDTTGAFSTATLLKQVLSRV
jgi:hypothetical protein